MAVFAGQRNSVALRRDGSLWAWGQQPYVDPKTGKLSSYAEGNIDLVLFPIRIGTRFKAVAVGNSHGLGLKNDGRVWAWGYNLCKQLGFVVEWGRHANYPFQVSGLEDVTSVLAAGDLSFATKKDGTVWAWGRIETIKQLEVALADGAKSDGNDTSPSAH